MWFNPSRLVMRAHRSPVMAGAGASGFGWDLFFDGCADHLGTGIRAFFPTGVRTASGWLPVRRLMFFSAAQQKSLGTELLKRLETRFRAASGWLCARASRIFPANPDVAPGTVRCLVNPAGVCAASGWLTAQTPAEDCAAEEGGIYHVPVFAGEVAAWMDAGPGKFILDGTLGGGGHSEAFLKAGARVLGIDRDPEALAHARARLAGFGGRFATWEGNFAGLQEIPEIRNGARADGLLLDLGVSSQQLNSPARGFSFMREGPLDMRMGPSSPHSAAEIVNQWDEAELVRVLFEFGEEPKARRIARAIVKQRTLRPFVSTLDLAACVEQAVGRHGRTHPATRSFQAIRMAVNEELESLAAALTAAPQVLKPGGRLLIITFHSLEDRLVKRFLRHRSTGFIDDPGWPEPRPNPDFQFQLLARKALTPSAEEISLNPRARSAKLRVARLLDPKP